MTGNISQDEHKNKTFGESLCQGLRRKIILPSRHVAHLHRSVSSGIAIIQNSEVPVVIDDEHRNCKLTIGCTKQVALSRRFAIITAEHETGTFES